MPLYEVEVREVWEFAYVREVQVNAKDEDEAEEGMREEDDEDEVEEDEGARIDLPSIAEFE